MLLRRLLESRLAGVRRAAHEVVDELDDRSRLFVLELAAEQQRLARLVIVVLGALVVTVIAMVWAAATVVALAWDTGWRDAALLGLLAFWVVFAAVLAVWARSLWKAGSEAFQLSRQVAGEDLSRLREALR